MATLLDLTSQGDVATITDDAYLNRTLQLMDPQQLYALWERQQWQSQAIDLERDKEQWAGLSAEDREEHLWGLSSFFVGEERVTTEFSGLVMSYEDEQEEAFLTTQQVDEARHMQFFDRFCREVLGWDQPDIRARLARDEHRHVAYGTWFLQQKASDDALVKRIQDKLLELLPDAAGVLVPPGYELGDDYTYMGFTAEEQ